MKNSKFVKIVLIIMVSFAVALVTKGTFAATPTLDPSSLTGITSTENSVTSKDNTLPENSIGNIGLGTPESIPSQNNAVLTTDNKSNYDNTSLPKTGVEDSIPVMFVVVVLGISAVYAYKKVQDYKNI